MHYTKHFIPTPLTVDPEDLDSSIYEVFGNNYVFDFHIHVAQPKVTEYSESQADPSMKQARGPERLPHEGGRDAAMDGSEESQLGEADVGAMEDAGDAEASDAASITSTPSSTAGPTARNASAGKKRNLILIKRAPNATNASPRLRSRDAAAKH